MRRPPCKDCPKRHGGCHDTCPEFIEWKEYRNALGDHMKEIRASQAEAMRMSHIYQAKKRGHKL